VLFERFLTVYDPESEGIKPGETVILNDKLCEVIKTSLEQSFQQATSADWSSVRSTKGSSSSRLRDGLRVQDPASTLYKWGRTALTAAKRAAGHVGSSADTLTADHAAVGNPSDVASTSAKPIIKLYVCYDAEDIGSWLKKGEQGA
jgi:hypothetical protein